MTHWLSKATTKALCITLSGLLVVEPALAQVRTDSQAPAANQSSLGNAPNGVPILNIAAPSAAGISHNKFTDFNVGSEGLILNNSRSVGQTQLGGVIGSNPNLAASPEARLILNEVTSTNRSQLLGYQEIFGRSADYILANPNGITCNGCGFINTPRATLTTGRPQFDGLGNLNGFDVDGGDVAIEGRGFNSPGLSYFDIISRTATINAEINAGNLSIITGRNQVDYASRAATAKADDGNPKPTVAIDSSALGGMYAGRISLVGTERGVGVALAGDMAASSGDLSISADGQISINNASAAGSVAVQSASQDIAASGRTRAGQEVRLASADNIAIGTAGDIGADSVVMQAASLANQGSVASEAGLQVQVTGQVTNDGSLTSDGQATVMAHGLANQGTIRGGTGLTATVTGVLDNAGTLGSDGTLTATAGTIRNQTGATMDATGAGSLTGNLVNAGDIHAAGDLDVQVASLDNSGTLKSAARLNLAGSGNVVVGGLLVGSTGLGLSAAGNFQSDGAQIFGVGPLALAISGDFVNSGALSVTGDLTGSVGSFANSGNLQVSNNIDVSVLGSVTNTDLLLALGTLSFQVGDTLTNDRGSIVSGGNLSLTGLGSARMVKLDNASGTIQSFNGDVLLAADTLLNRKTAFAMSSQLIFSQFYAANTTSHPGCNSVPGNQISSAGCAYFSRGTVAAAPDPFRDNWVSYYSSVSGDGGIRVTAYQDVATTDSPAALISAAGKLTIDGGAITNNLSNIQAGGDIAMTGTSLSNVGATITRQVYHDASAISDGVVRCYGGPCTQFDFDKSARMVENEVVGSYDAKIVAGGSFTGSFTGQVNNTTIVQQSISMPSGGIPVVTQITQATPDQANVPVTAVQPGGTFTPPSPGLYQHAAPDRDYVLETRFDYTDFGTFYGSDYFLNQVGLSTADTETLPKRLGDAFFDTSIVQQQVLQQTGQRFVGGATSDAAQMQALIDAAAAQHAALDLTVGVALTADQIAALTDSIVWYVEEEYEGQKVLVPKLYLASADKGDVTPAGAFIAGADVAIQAGRIENSGQLAAANGLELDAQDSIVNASGQIAAGGNVRLVATNGDVINTTASQTVDSDIAHQDLALARGGIYAGGNLTVEAGHDINVEGADLSAGGDASLQAANDVILTTKEISRDVGYATSGYSYKQQSLTNLGSSLVAGGNVSVTAGHDIGLKGSDIGAGQDIALQAANDVTITAAQDYSYQFAERKKSHSYHSGETESLTSVGSSLQAGRDVTVTSGADLLVRGSGIAAGQDATLTGETVTIDSLADSFYQQTVDRRSRWSGGLSGGMVSIGKEKTSQTVTVSGTTQSGSLVMAGRDLTVQANQDAVIRASGLGAGRDLDIEAGRDLSVQAAAEQTSSHEVFEHSFSGLRFGVKENLSGVVDAAGSINDGEGSGANKAISAASGALRTVSAALQALQQTVAVEVGFSTSKTRLESSQSTETAAVGNLSAGRDATLTAGRDLGLQGTQLASGGDTTLIAGRDATLESAQNSYSSSYSQSSKSAGVAVSVGYGAFGPSASVTASASASGANYSQSGTSQTNTHVNAGGDVVLLTGNDAALKGAVVTGDNVLVDVGGDLLVQSVPDIGSGKGSSWSAGVSLGASISGTDPGAALGDGGTTALGLSGSSGSSSDGHSWITEQSGIVGRGDVDVTVQGHTQLDAGVIASTGGDVSLDTGSLGWSDAAGYDRSRSTTIGAGGSIGLGGGAGSDGGSGGSGGSGAGGSRGGASLPPPGLPLDTASLDYSAADREQVTRATVAAPNGSTTITVRDTPAQDLSQLNQDLARAQELTKDTKSSVRVYVDRQAIEEIANGLPTIGAALTTLQEQLSALKQKPDVTPDDVIQAIEKIELPSSGPTSPEKHAEQEQQLRTVLGDYAMSLVNKGMSPAEAADYIEQMAPLIGEAYAWVQQNQLPDGSLPLTVESGVQPAMAQAVILGVAFTVVVVVAVAEEMRKNGSSVSDAIQKVFSSGQGVIVKNDPDNPDQPKVEIGPTTPERGIGDNGGPPMDEDPENGGGNNQGPIYPAPLTAKEAFDNIFKDKVDFDRITSSGTKIEAVPNGTWDQANTDFDKLALSDVRPIDTNYGPGRMGTLPDGTKVIVRPGSSDGRPTIEFQRDTGRKMREIRYGSN